MGFAILTQTMTANQELAFDFTTICDDQGGTIQQIVYGISQFTLQVASGYFDSETGSSIQDMIISLSQTSGGIGAKSVTLLADITLSPVSEPTCSVSVTVLVYIGNTNSVLLANQIDITGISNNPITKLTGVPNVCAGVLSGFSFTSSDDSDILGFGASAGAVLQPGNAPTSPAVLPMGNGVCLVTNHEPMTTTVDVGAIIFTGEQADVVTGTIVDCMSFTSNSSQTGTTITVDTPFPVSSQIAVFLQSFSLQFMISAGLRPTPPFNSAVVGASNITPGSTGFTFKSSQNLYSCQLEPVPGSTPYYSYNYGVSYTATYFYVALSATG